MIETPAQPPTLRPYACAGWNQRTHRPCTATIIDAYAVAGALVRRRCNDCGTWQVVRVQAEVTNPAP